MKVDICNWALLCCKKSLKNITKPIVILNICYDFAQFLCYIMYYYPTMSHHQQWFLNRVMRDFLVYTTTAQSTTHSQSQTLVLQYLMNFRQHVFFAKKKKKCWKKKLPPPDLFDPQKSLWYMDEKSWPSFCVKKLAAFLGSLFIH